VNGKAAARAARERAALEKRGQMVRRGASPVPSSTTASSTSSSAVPSPTSCACDSSAAIKGVRSLSTASSWLRLVSKFEQCGGKGYSGSTCCTLYGLTHSLLSPLPGAAGYQCQYSSECALLFVESLSKSDDGQGIRNANQALGQAPAAMDSGSTSHAGHSRLSEAQNLQMLEARRSIWPVRWHRLRQPNVLHLRLLLPGYGRVLQSVRVCHHQGATGCQLRWKSCIKQLQLREGVVN
jgi:hypothetical protein